jgi:ABC-2 type transport system permease protein
MGARRAFRVYRLLLGASVRGALQYRVNLLITVAAGVAYQGSGFAFLWVLLHSVGTVAGWGLGQLAFLYGLRLLAHALWLVTLAGLTRADDLIREGVFERMLLRPADPLLQMAAYRRDVMPFGDVTVALAVFVIAASVAHVAWSPLTVLYLVLMVAGGALIEASAQVVVSAVTIRVQNTWPLRMFVDDSIGNLSSYPMAVFGTGTQRLLTYALPVAFVAYLPASLLLGRTGDLAVPAALGYATPLVGVALFALAYLLWTRQLRHYQGVGH